MDMQVKMASIFGYVGGIVAVPLSYLIVGGILLGIVRGIMSAPVSGSSRCSRSCVMPACRVLIFTVLAIAVMFLKNPDDFNLQNPLVFNPGAFMDPQSTLKFLYSVASSLRPVYDLDDSAGGHGAEGRRREEALVRRRADGGGAAVGDFGAGPRIAGGPVQLSPARDKIENPKDRIGYLGDSG